MQWRGRATRGASLVEVAEWRDNGGVLTCHGKKEVSGDASESKKASSHEGGAGAEEPDGEEAKLSLSDLIASYESTKGSTYRAGSQGLGGKSGETETKKEDGEVEQEVEEGSERVGEWILDTVCWEEDGEQRTGGCSMRHDHVAMVARGVLEAEKKRLHLGDDDECGYSKSLRVVSVSQRNYEGE